MKGLHSISESKAIFEIALSNHEKAYMAASRTNYNNDERYVVIVKSSKFVELWRSDPYKHHSEISMGSPESWRNDRKYKDAEIGFSYGLSNPVPLANISCNQQVKKIPVYKKKFIFFKSLITTEEKVIHYIAFSNGITRTIWLLTNGAKYFPIECYSQEEALRLAEKAGYNEKEFCSIEQLINIT